MGTPSPTDRVSLLTPSDTARSPVAEGRPLQQLPFRFSPARSWSSPAAKPRQSSNSRLLPHLPRFDPPTPALAHHVLPLTSPCLGTPKTLSTSQNLRGVRPSLLTPSVRTDDDAHLLYRAGRTVEPIMNCGFVNHTSQAIRFSRSPPIVLSHPKSGECHHDPRMNPCFSTMERYRHQ